MSNEKMREEFERAWLDAGNTNGSLAKEIDGSYKGDETYSAFHWWRKSRSALCVELPKVGICAMTNDIIGYTRGIRDCRSAIESTGVRTR
jgi:hypothetical protein